MTLYSVVRGLLSRVPNTSSANAMNSVAPLHGAQGALLSPRGKDASAGTGADSGDGVEPFDLWKAWADQFREVTTPDLEEGDW